MMSSQALRLALRDAAAVKNTTESKWVQAVRDGTAPLGELARYAGALWMLADGFPKRLSAVLAHCDNQAIRLSLLKNLLEEEGVQRYQHGELQFCAERGHGPLAAVLAKALGQHSLPEPAATPWLDAQLRSGAWRAAFGFMGIGYEHSVPATFALLIKGLRQHYGLKDAELEFLELHCEADVRHGDEAIELLVAACRNEADAVQALNGARRGALSWWLLHEQFNPLGQSLRVA